MGVSRLRITLRCSAASVAGVRFSAVLFNATVSATVAIIMVYLDSEREHQWRIGGRPVLCSF
jgi:hypothetical protein